MMPVLIALAFYTFAAAVLTWVVTAANRNLLAPEVSVDRFGFRVFLCFVPLIAFLTWLTTS